MGFPAGYTEVLLPKLLITTLSFLGFIRRLILTLLRSLGLHDFIEPEFDSSPRPGPDPVSPVPARSLSATLIWEMLPVTRYADVTGPVRGGPHGPAESCAVCLYEFECEDEIRRLRNCPHMFYRSCVDRWIDHDRKTCPL